MSFYTKSKNFFIPVHKQSGLTLIEIMIALLLGLFLIGGIIQVFITNKQSYRLMEAQSRLQENGRFALELLNHDIRLAGYVGCSGIVNAPPKINPTVIANAPLVVPVDHFAGATAGIVAASSLTAGNDYGGSFDSPQPALSTNPPDLTKSADPITNAITGSDAITVQFTESCGGYTTVATNSVNPTGVIAATNTCGITNGTGTSFAQIGTPLVISDCSTAHIFRASANTSQNKDNLGGVADTFTGKAAPGYAPGSEILLFRSYTYYIRLGAGGQPSLWRLNNNYPLVANSNPEEMIEGIEDMEITYGSDTDADGSANRYIETTAGANIVSVRIVLTVRSIDDNILPSDNPQRSYNGNNALVDRRLVKTFTTTIDLRNR
ncbi:hypothetical protein MCAMS1_02479 [biofilm metagenome]